MSKQYRKAPHCVYDLKYYVGWITKNRKPVLGKEVGTRVRELVRMICASLDVEDVRYRMEHFEFFFTLDPREIVENQMRRISWSMR
jgi:REP element-mobilizing transposase RayT